MLKGTILVLGWRSRLLYLASVAVTALLIAGCGDEEKQPAEPVELEETLGFSDEGIVERQSRVEGQIRDCMKAQGFDYVPVDPFAQQQALTGKARQSEEDFIEQFGYGISTLFGRGTAQSDPNDRIRKSLSAADRAAYDRALGGENPGVTFREAVDAGDFSELGGCTKQATDAEFGGAGVAAKLVAKFDELDERIIQDQRMVRANERWSECMRKQGYRYEEPDAIDGDLEERFQAIVGSGVRPGTATPPPGTSYDRAALADLQREEVKIANADLACERREITPVERIVRPQYEKEFRQNSSNAKLIRSVRAPGR
jgi:hypothetical protein